MNFTKPYYNLETNKGHEIIGEAWENGIRHFKVKGFKRIYKSFELPHHAVLEEEKPIVKVNKEKDDLIRRIEALEAQVEILTKNNKKIV